MLKEEEKKTTKEIIESTNKTKPKIIFYSDKISLRLKNNRTQFHFGMKSFQMARLGIVKCLIS